MHIAWIQSKHPLDQCPLCLDDVLHIPWENRVDAKYPIPCKKHGDPRLLPDNEDAVRIYKHLAPGDMTCIQVLEPEDGKDVLKNKFFLRTEPIKLLCDAYGVDFLDTLHKLEIIHTVWAQ